MKKSYHSNAVPVDEAATTLAIDQARALLGFGLATLAMVSPLRRRNSSASRSVQLADDFLEAGDGDSEAFDPHLVVDARVRPGSALLEVEMVLAVKADSNGLVLDVDADRAGCIS